MTHRTAHVPILILAAALLLGPALVPAGVSGAATAEAGGKLKDIEDKVREGKDRDEGGGGGGSHSGHSGKGHEIDAEDVEFIVLLVRVVGRVLLFPWWSYQYQAYPYQAGPGYLDYSGNTPWTEPGTAPLVGREVTVEARGFYWIDSPTLQGLGAYGKLRLTCWINIDAEALHLWEWSSPRDYDSLSLTKLDVLFNISSSPWHDLDFGIGYSYMEGVDLYGGVNAKLTADVFPVKPLGLHGMACSSAINGVTINEAELAVGAFWNRLEWRVGYRWMWVEGVRIDGFMAGLAVWF